MCLCMHGENEYNRWHILFKQFIFRQPETDKMVQFLDPETEKKITISGPRNSSNGSAKMLGTETYKIVQIMCPETDIMGERIYINEYNHPF